MGKPRRIFTPEFKQDAVDLLRRRTRPGAAGARPSSKSRTEVSFHRGREGGVSRRGLV